jgi:hypothetical protein
MPQPKKQPSETYHRPVHFARLYGTHVNTVIRWCRDGVLFSDGSTRRPRHVRTPGGYHITEQDLSAFLDEVKLDRCSAPQADAPVRPRRASKRTEELAITNAELKRAGF